MADDVLSMLFKLDADPHAAAEALEGFQGKVEGIVGSLTNSFNGLGGVITRSLGGISPLAMVAAVGIAALAGGMIELAKRSAEAGAKIYELHEITGLSAEALSGMSAYAKLTGESLDSLGMAMGRMGKSIAMGLQNPTSLAGQQLTKLMGSSQALTQLGLKPMDDQIQTILNRIFALTDVGQRNLALQAMLGRGWMSNVETLKLLAEQGFAPAIARAKELGLFFDQQGAQQAKAFIVEIKTMQAEVNSLSLVLGKELIPALMRVAEGWLAITERFRAEGFLSEIAEWGHGIFTYLIHPLNLAQEAMLRLTGNIQAANRVALADAKMQMEQEDQWAKALNKVHDQVAAITEEIDKQTKNVLPVNAKAIKEVTDRLKEMLEAQRENLAVLQEEDKPFQAEQRHYDAQVRMIEKTFELQKKEVKGKKDAAAQIAKFRKEADDAEDIAAQIHGINVLAIQKKINDEKIKEEERVAKEWEHIRAEQFKVDRTVEEERLKDLKHWDDEAIKEFKRKVAEMKKAHEELRKEEMTHLKLQKQQADIGMQIFDQLANTVKGYAGIYLKAMEQIAVAVINEMLIEQEAAISKTLNDAMKTESEERSITAIAIKHAMKDYALAAENFAAQDYVAGAGYTAAAVMWAAVAAAPIAMAAYSAASAMGGGSRGAGGGSGSYGGPGGGSGYGTGVGVPRMATGAVAPTGGASGGLRVIVVGDARGGQVIASILNDHVRNNGGLLYSSHTARPAPAVRSGGG